MPTPHDPRQNQLLDALPAAEPARLFPHLELVPMPLGHSLCEPGLEARVCGSYQVVRTKFDRLLPAIRAL